MSENMLFVGSGAGIVGLVIGFLMGGVDEDKLVDSIGAKVSAGAKSAEQANADQMAQVTETIAALSAQVTELQENQTAVQSAGAEKLDAAVAALDDRISAVSAELAEVVSTSGASQTAQIEAALAGGMAELQGSLGTMAAVATAAATAAPASGEDAVTPDPAAEPAIEGTRVGETKVLLDGAARVFVSGMNAEEGTVRVAINGTSTQMLGSYHKVSFSAGGKDCLLQLDGVTQGHVQMTANCAE
ncbi:MAG: hypothetical protein AAFN27_17765 [Pseudomonadota bacterium]